MTRGEIGCPLRFEIAHQHMGCRTPLPGYPVTVEQSVRHVGLERAVSESIGILGIAVFIGTAIWKHLRGENNLPSIGSDNRVCSSKRKRRQLPGLSSVKRECPQLVAALSSRNEVHGLSVSRPARMIIDSGAVGQLTQILAIAVDEKYIAVGRPCFEVRG